jgi:hypothetical protein
MEHHFYLKDKWQTAIIQTMGLIDIFSKMNEVSLSFQDRQLTVFVANRIWTFKWKLEFGKHIYPCRLDFCDEFSGDINKYNF